MPICTYQMRKVNIKTNCNVNNYNEVFKAKLPLVDVSLMNYTEVYFFFQFFGREDSLYTFIHLVSLNNFYIFEYISFENPDNSDVWCFIQ